MSNTHHRAPTDADWQGVWTAFQSLSGEPVPELVQENLRLSDQNRSLVEANASLHEEGERLILALAEQSAGRMHMSRQLHKQQRRLDLLQSQNAFLSADNRRLRDELEDIIGICAEKWRVFCVPLLSNSRANLVHCVRQAKDFFYNDPEREMHSLRVAARHAWQSFRVKLLAVEDQALSNQVDSECLRIFLTVLRWTSLGKVLRRFRFQAVRGMIPWDRWRFYHARLSLCALDHETFDKPRLSGSLRSYIDLKCTWKYLIVLRWTSLGKVLSDYRLRAVFRLFQQERWILFRLKLSAFTLTVKEAEERLDVVSSFYERYVNYVVKCKAKEIFSNKSFIEEECECLKVRIEKKIQGSPDLSTSETLLRLLRSYPYIWRAIRKREKEIVGSKIKRFHVNFYVLYSRFWDRKGRLDHITSIEILFVQGVWTMFYEKFHRQVELLGDISDMKLQIKLPSDCRYGGASQRIRLFFKFDKLSTVLEFYQDHAAEVLGEMKLHFPEHMQRKEEKFRRTGVALQEYCKGMKGDIERLIAMKYGKRFKITKYTVNDSYQGIEISSYMVSKKNNAVIEFDKCMVFVLNEATVFLLDGCTFESRLERILDLEKRLKIEHSHGKLLNRWNG
jgi:hypothetical protein